MTGGFQAGNLIVIAARPSMGKSALVANIAENAVLARLSGGAVLARDVRVRARAALRRLAGEDQGRGAAAGQGRRGSLAEDPRGVPAPGRTRRCSSTTRATPACSRSAPSRAASTTRSRTASG